MEQQAIPTNRESTPNSRQPWQSSGVCFLIAGVFLAIACVAVEKSVLSMDLREAGVVDSNAPVFWLFAIPVLLCGAIGILRGYLEHWLCYGVGIDLVLLVYLGLPRIH